MFYVTTDLLLQAQINKIDKKIDTMAKKVAVLRKKFEKSTKLSKPTLTIVSSPLQTQSDRPYLREKNGAKLVQIIEPNALDVLDMEFNVPQRTSSSIDVEEMSGFSNEEALLQIALALSTETREVDDDVTGLRDLTGEEPTVFDIYGQLNCESSQEAIGATDVELGVPTAQYQNPQHRQERVSISITLQTTKSDNFI